LAGRGPAPKDLERRQTREPVGAGGKPRLQVVRSISQAPEPRKEWLEETKSGWGNYWASDISALVQPHQVQAVERMFSLIDQRERAYIATRKRPLVDGSQGQKVLNPLLRQIAVWDAEIRQLEDRFGGNPRALLALGQSFGDAARSLEEMNRAFGADDDQTPDERSTALQLTNPGERKTRAASDPR
jgi:hypothetical protein